VPERVADHRRNHARREKLRSRETAIQKFQSQIGFILSESPEVPAPIRDALQHGQGNDALPVWFATLKAQMRFDKTLKYGLGWAEAGLQSDAAKFNVGWS